MDNFLFKSQKSFSSLFSLVLISCKMSRREICFNIRLYNTCFIWSCKNLFQVGWVAVKRWIITVFDTDNIFNMKAIVEVTLRSHTEGAILFQSQFKLSTAGLRGRKLKKTKDFDITAWVPPWALTQLSVWLCAPLPASDDTLSAPSAGYAQTDTWINTCMLAHTSKRTCVNW